MTTVDATFFPEDEPWSVYNDALRTARNTFLVADFETCLSMFRQIADYCNSSYKCTQDDRWEDRYRFVIDCMQFVRIVKMEHEHGWVVFPAEGRDPDSLTLAIE